MKNPNSCLLKWYNFFWNFYYNRILAVHHDFHWLLIATKLLAIKLHSRYVKESELESDILIPIPQICSASIQRVETKQSTF